MYKSYILSLAISVIPILALSFVCLMILYKIYLKIRSKFNKRVNCWFCNENTKVPYNKSNEWTCPNCEQYNGFNKDGDYNREIHDLSNFSTSSKNYAYINNKNGEDMTFCRPAESSNGFCNVCNEAQRIKIEKIAQFEPKNMKRFEQEFKSYKLKLEEQYRLCNTCDNHLKKVLRGKKKMVLGSKFLDFIIKGAETSKKPYINHLEYVKKQKCLKFFAFLIIISAVIEIICLISLLPSIKRENVVNIFGLTIGQKILEIFGHVIAFGRAFAAYLDHINQHEFMHKIRLFSRTIYLMIVYSLGVKSQHILNINFSTLYILSFPYAMICLTFGHVISNGFKLTRFTFLLVLWSAIAGSIIQEYLWISKNVFMLISTIITAILCLTTKTDSSYKRNNKGLHKIYTDECFTDDETISMLSEQLSANTSSLFNSTTSPSNRSIYTSFSTSPQTINSGGCNLSRYSSQIYSPSNAMQSRERNFYNNNNNNDDDDVKSIRSCYSTTSFNYNNINNNNKINSTSPLSSPLNNELNTHQQHQHYNHPYHQYRMNANNKQYINNNTIYNSNHDSILDSSQSSIRNRKFHYDNTLSSLTSKSKSSLFHSPFSTSNNSIYSIQSTNVLQPARLNINPKAANNSATTSWLSGGYFNQQRPQSLLPSSSSSPRPSLLPTTTIATALFDTSLPPPTIIPPALSSSSSSILFHNNGKLNDVNTTAILSENLSRASSHSSGFESQNSARPNFSRESSHASNAADILERTLLLDNHNKGLNGRRNAAIQQKSSLQMNCSMTASQFQNTLTSQKTKSDSFNLREINAELPPLKRGDLLKKWMQRQEIS